MKKTIKQRAKDLEAIERKARTKLDESETHLRKRAKKIGLIALASGIVAVVIYWAFRAFSPEPDEKPSRNKKSGKRSRISSIATPYLVDFFRKLLDLEEE